MARGVKFLTVDSLAVHRCLKRAHYGYVLGTRSRSKRAGPSSWDLRTSLSTVPGDHSTNPVTPFMYCTT
eukprot:5298188-Pyramimonas_sp.AAC.1